MGRDRNARNSSVTSERTGVASLGGTTTPPQPDSPGGKEEDQRQNEEKQGSEDKQDETPGPASTASTNRIERALIHLDFLEQELKGLTSHGSELLGPMRRSALIVREQFDGPIHKWPPLAKIRALLMLVKEQRGTS